MASEAVGILISAEDKATAELKKAEKAFMQFEKVRARELDYLKLQRIELEKGAEAAHSMKLQMDGLDQATADLIAREQAHINELKKQRAEQEKVSGPSGAKGTKATAEFFGAVASFAGAGEIGSVASQVGGLTEKVSQFGEVSKAGGAGAMLFKAGLVAAAGAIGFSIGKALGDVIFQTEKWNKEIAKATERANELKAAIADANSLRFEDAKADIELIRDPEKKSAAYKALMEETKTNLIGIENQARASEKAAKEWSEAWQITGNRKEYAKQAEQQAKDDRERLKAKQAEFKELERLQGIEAERAAKQKENAALDASENYIKSLREQLELEKAVGDEKAKIEASRNAVGADVAVAEGLLKELEAVRLLNEEKKKQEEERKRQEQEEQAARKRIIDLLANENQKLQERAIAIEKGSQASKAFALESQGVAKAEAERIAAREEELNRMERNKQVEQNKKEQNPALQAAQSRTLMRGSGEGFQVKIADSAKKTVDILAEIRVLQRELITATREKKPVEINLEQR